VWKLLLIVLIVGFGTGFALGYSIRAGISSHRRSLAARNRMFMS